jgi:hypothetical protein
MNVYSSGSIRHANSFVNDGLQKVNAQYLPMTRLMTEAATPVLSTGIPWIAVRFARPASKFVALT